jgi:hypothetical protein
MIPGANSNLSWSEQYRIVAKQWNDANAAADLLKETKDAMLSQMMLKQGDMPVSRAEMIVKASQEWTDFIKSMVEARREANYLKVKKEYVRMKFMEYLSENANKREEMRL